MEKVVVRFLFVCLLGLSASALPLQATAQPAAHKWEFGLMPYLWLPSANGDLNYGPPAAGGATPSVSVDSDKILESLKGALMLEGSARYGRWLIGADLMYMKLSGNPGAIRHVDFNPGGGPVNVTNSTVNLGTNSELEGRILTAVGGYELLQKPRAHLHAIAGLRYVRMEANTNWNLSAVIAGPGGGGLTLARSGSVSKTETVVDGIIGVRGRFSLGDGNWFVPYYADIGTGDSNRTYQALLGVGYGFKWGEVLLSYRRLHYDMGGNKLLNDFAFSGPALGANFRF